MTQESISRSLLFRVLLRVLPAVLVAVLAIGWLASTVMNNMVSKELKDRLRYESKQNARVLAVKTDALFQTAVSIAENDLIVNGIIDAEERGHYLPMFFETMQVPGPAGAEVTLTDYRGRRLASNLAEVDYRDASWSTGVLSGLPWRGLSREGFTVAVPVMIDGVAEGMVVIRYGAAHLARFLRTPSQTGAIAVTTKTGDVLYSSNPALTTTLFESASDTSSDWEVASADIPWFANLQLLTGRKKSAAFAVVDKLNYFLWATMFACITAVTIAIVATAFMSTRPVRRLIGGIEEITRTGNLDSRIEPDGALEFHRLAGAFNRMLASLKATTASRDALQHLNMGLAEVNQALDQANADLEESKSRFQLAVRASSAGIWEWDAKTDALFWSDHLKAMLGISDPTFEPTLSIFMDRLHPDDLDVVMERRGRHLELQDDYDVECRLRHEDGSYVWVRKTGQAVWDEAGNPVRMAGSVNDISARKLAEVERDRHAAELERSNRELDDFAHIASHDLKEPLRAIYNHASFLLEDYEDKLGADGQKRLHRLISLSKRMEMLIGDLLYYSRLGRGEQAFESLDLNTVIANIETNLADTLAARQARLILPEPLPKAAGSRPMMTTVFQNLISNAAKYNESKDKIVEIGTARPEQHPESEAQTVFYVRDNGIGIDPIFKDDIFRIFKRLNSDKQFGEGTGAGLTFVKKIIENHGGRIWLESLPGEGSTFFFTLSGGLDG